VTEQEIEDALAALGQELQRLGVQQPIRILVVGGAYMLTQLHNRLATTDIDVLLIDIADPGASPVYQQVQTGVRAIASQRHLPATWFNDVIGDALRSNGVVPNGTLWRVYGALEVYMPDAEYVLALKLLAGRPQDTGDIQALIQRTGVQTRDQAQQLLDRYIPDRQTQQLNQAPMTLQRMFP
jgi:hypothetical protein